MKAPFPWFGGKFRVASTVWQRFGNVPNYVEPFAGSLAVLLDRPTAPGIETVNDLDGLLANFWRAVALQPNEVARWADWPVSECDLHARHLWLVGQIAGLADRLCADPDWCDPKIAGWWVWGLCSWIGSGWCSGNGPWTAVDGVLVKGNAGRGINRQLPHLGDAGQGINRQGTVILNTMRELSQRLRGVRICQGDWARVCGESVTHKHGLTGVFLDPPYLSADTAGDLYRTDSVDVAHAVREWALANGGNKMLRIALCGYEGEHEMPGWECVAWKAQGGMGSQRADKSNGNAGRERIWFSPHCLSGKQGSLF
jgi:site-specific DNA-adenine methylase